MNEHKERKSQVGDIIIFGSFEWLVLDIQDNKALIITEQVIEHRPFHRMWENNYVTSDIRHYLNNGFFNRFDETDKKRNRNT